MTDLYAQIVENRNKPTPYLDALRDAVRAEGGDWTVDRAQSLFMSINWRTSPSGLQLMLNRLAEEGLLIKHGARGKLWTPAEPPVPPTVEYRIDSLLDVNVWHFIVKRDNEEEAREAIATIRSEHPSRTYRLLEITTRIIDDGEKP